MIVKSSLLPSKTTIGIIGNDNIDLLFLAMHRLGVRIGVYTSQAQSNPIYKIANFVVHGNSLNDQKQLKSFASRCDIVTYLNGQLDSRMVKYLQRYTRVPQGSDLLDAMHDRSIQHALFNIMGIPCVPYQTIVSLADIRKATTSFGYPAILKPIQVSLFHDRQLVIKDNMGITAAAGMLRGGTYLLEPLERNCHHFSVLVTKSANQTQGTFPLIEKYYQHHQLMASNTFDNDSDKVGHQMKTLALKVSKQLHYVGSLEVSFILSAEHKVYIEGIKPAFTVMRLLFNDEIVNVDEMHLRALMGANVGSVYPATPKVAIRVSNDNRRLIKQKWFQNPDSTLYTSQNDKIALLSTDSPQKIVKQFIESSDS